MRVVTTRLNVPSRTTPVTTARRRATSLKPVARKLVEKASRSHSVDEARPKVKDLTTWRKRR